MSNRLMEGPGAPRRPVDGEVPAGLNSEGVLKVSCERLRLEQLGQPSSPADAIASLTKIGGSRVEAVLKR